MEIEGFKTIAITKVELTVKIFFSHSSFQHLFHDVTGLAL